MIPILANVTKSANWIDSTLAERSGVGESRRDTEGHIYPWGNDFDGTRLNYCDSNCPYNWKDKTGNDGYATTAPVGSFPHGASPYGALDMAGNVWEWTISQYIAYPYQVKDGREDEIVADARRVLRGGSWYHGPGDVRVADRFSGTPTYRYFSVGFRVVLSAPQ